jgi:hypothetical protein
MINLPYWGIALITGSIGGIFSVLTTLSVERLGGILGGTIGTLPHIVLPAVIGAWLSVISLTTFN